MLQRTDTLLTVQLKKKKTKNRFFLDSKEFI